MKDFNRDEQTAELKNYIATQAKIDLPKSHLSKASKKVMNEKEKKKSCRKIHKS